MTRTPLTPLDPTETARRPTYRRQSRPDSGTRGEIIRAMSADHEWTYLRDDERRGSWHLRHRTGHTLWNAATSLRGARAYTASGQALRDLPTAA